jgi:hypothetical protein
MGQYPLVAFVPPLPARALNLAGCDDVFEPSDFHRWHRGEEEVCVVVEGRREDRVLGPYQTTLPRCMAAI